MNRFTRLLLIAALLYGTGAHWAAVQATAWVAMVVERAPARGLSAAVASVIGRKSPCRVCLVVDRGAGAEQPARVVQPSVHFIALGPVSMPVRAPVGRVVPPLLASFASSLRRPPSPPPKAILAV